MSSPDLAVHGSAVPSSQRHAHRPPDVAGFRQGRDRGAAAGGRPASAGGYKGVGREALSSMPVRAATVVQPQDSSRASPSKCTDFARHSARSGAQGRAVSPARPASLSQGTAAARRVPAAQAASPAAWATAAPQHPSPAQSSGARRAAWPARSGSGAGAAKPSRATPTRPASASRASQSQAAAGRRPAYPGSPRGTPPARDGAAGEGLYRAGGWAEPKASPAPLPPPSEPPPEEMAWLLGMASGMGKESFDGSGVLPSALSAISPSGDPTGISPLPGRSALFSWPPADQPLLPPSSPSASLWPTDAPRGPCQAPDFASPGLAITSSERSRAHRGMDLEDAFYSDAAPLPSSLRGVEALGLDFHYGGSSPSAASQHLQGSLPDEVIGLLSASFKFATPGGGDWAAACEVVLIASSDPMLQKHLASSPELGQVLQRIQRHPGGRITWDEVRSYLTAASCRGEPAPTMADTLRSSLPHPLQAEASQAGVSGSVRPAAHWDDGAQAQTGIMALRKWLETQWGPLHEVAKEIRSRVTAPLDTLASYAAVEEFLSEVQCEAVRDGTLDCIFEFLDPEGRGMIDLEHLLGPFQLGMSPAPISSTGDFGVCGARSSLDEGDSPGREQESARDGINALAQVEAEAKMAETNAMLTADWMVLRTVFHKLLRDDCVEVPVRPLLARISEDHQVKRVALLDRIVEMTAGERQTTLAQALEHVEAQSLRTVSWETFRRIILDAQRSRRLTLGELMSLDMPDAGTCGPNLQPELANNWMETSLGVDRGMLRRIFGIFLHCQRGGPSSSAVRKGDFVSKLQKNPSLMTSFASTPLCSEAFSDRAAKPQVWGDVLVHLNCHESDVLTWGHVLEVIRWHCDLCFDRVPASAVGPGGHRCERGRPGPAFANGKAQDRLARLMTGSKECTAAFEDGNFSLNAALAPEDVPFAGTAFQNARQQLLPSQQHNGAVDGDVRLDPDDRSPVESARLAPNPPAAFEDVASARAAVEPVRRTLSPNQPSKGAVIEGAGVWPSGLAEPASPAAAICGIFDKALGAEPRGGGQGLRPSTVHPFLDYESDGEAEQQDTAEESDHAAVARLLVAAAERTGGPAAASALRHAQAVDVMPRPTASSMVGPACPGKREASVRIRLDGNHLGASAQQLERAIAEILRLNPSDVRLKPLRHA